MEDLSSGAFMFHLGESIYFFFLLCLGKSCASFTKPFSIGYGGENGGFACCAFNGSLYCLGGTSGMFGLVDLNSEHLRWMSTGAHFPRVHHALLTFGSQLIALGGTNTETGLSMYSLFVQDSIGHMIDGRDGSVLFFLTCPLAPVHTRTTPMPSMVSASAFTHDNGILLFDEASLASCFITISGNILCLHSVSGTQPWRVGTRAPPPSSPLPPTPPPAHTKGSGKNRCSRVISAYLLGALLDVPSIVLSRPPMRFVHGPSSMIPAHFLL